MDAELGSDGGGSPARTHPRTQPDAVAAYDAFAKTNRDRGEAAHGRNRAGGMFVKHTWWLSQDELERKQQADAAGERVGESGPFICRAQSPKPAGALRKGKWTAEEENYTSCIIQDFNKGYLPIVAGTTLRSFLSEKVRHHPLQSCGSTPIATRCSRPTAPVPPSPRR